MWWRFSQLVAMWRRGNRGNKCSRGGRRVVSGIISVVGGGRRVVGGNHLT